MCEIRLLKANEIEVRPQTIRENGCSLLLYKDARCDMAILDETFGMKGWKRSHDFKNGNNYCTVSIWDEDKQEWISKEDVGTESNADKEKGQASDAFKRACVNIGIGRELYTAPFIWVSLAADEVKKGNNGSCSLKFGLSFSVKEVEYDEATRSIKNIVIIDNKGIVRYPKSQPNDEPKQKPLFKREMVTDEALGKIASAEDRARAKGETFSLWNYLAKYYEISDDDKRYVGQLLDSFKQAKNNQNGSTATN